MEIIKSLSDTGQYHSKIFNEYYGGLNLAVIDIETDGLNPTYSKIILGGLLIPQGENSPTIQYFLDHREDEKELLAAYGQALTHSDVLISYNGDRFDLPFLKHRFLKHGLDIDLDGLQSFDLYKVLNRHSNLREILPNLKQKSIENFLGLSSLRKDEISGAESVELYGLYLKTASPDAREKILLHNRDDLIQLWSIIKVLDKLDLHRIAFNEGFILAKEGKKIIINNISFKKNSIDVRARTKNLNLDYYSFEGTYQAIHKALDREFSISLPYDSKKGAAFWDLEAFNQDFSTLESFPAYESGFLILKDGRTINYAEINKAVKIILADIMDNFML